MNIGMFNQITDRNIRQAGTHTHTHTDEQADR